MSQETENPPSTSALSTKVEEDFISPLTAIRGALEILRDFPDLTSAERAKFVDTALQECARISRGVEHLAETVYAAGRQVGEAPVVTAPTDERFAGRINFSKETGIADLDFSDFEFNGSDVVNAFYDAIDTQVRAHNRKWIFLVNHHNTRVWPEAWVAFAHRSKKISVNFASTTVRYAEGDSDFTSSDPSLFESREAALAEVARMEATGHG